ncbi:MAG: nickel-responsive transcriptional regulator NikR [Bacillota bacterium]
MMVRFGVSVEEGLLARFDRLVKEKGYANRSEALRDLMRAQLIAEEWRAGTEVVGAIVLVYDHEVHGLEANLTDLAHAHAAEIISTLHVHLDARHCLEVMAVRGDPVRLKRLADLFRAQRGVRHGELTMTGVA